MSGLSDYERGYRAAQDRGMELYSQFGPRGQYERYDEHGLIRRMKIERAEPVPDDPERDQTRRRVQPSITRLTCSECGKNVLPGQRVLKQGGPHVDCQRPYNPKGDPPARSLDVLPIGITQED